MPRGRERRRSSMPRPVCRRADRPDAQDCRRARHRHRVERRQGRFGARESGADEVIVTTGGDFVAAVRDLTGGKGVDVVYDGVGKDTFDGSLRALAKRGTLVLYGASSGAVPPLDPMVLGDLGSLSLMRTGIIDYIGARDELDARERHFRMDRRWAIARPHRPGLSAGRSRSGASSARGSAGAGQAYPDGALRGDRYADMGSTGASGGLLLHL